MHTFSEATIGEDLSALVADELGGLGLVGSEEEYSQALFAIMASTQPDADQLGAGRAWCEDVSGGLLVVDRAEAVRPRAKAG